MNLKTHTGYPEIVVAEDNSWEGKILAIDGTVLQTFKGEADSRPEAIKAAKEKLAAVMDDYLRPVEEEESISADDVGDLESIIEGEE